MSDHGVSESGDASLTICLAISGPNTGGGIERHVRDLARGLAGRHTIHVIAHESFRALFDSKVSFHEVGFTSWRYDLWFLFQFVRCIRAIQPTIVHVHGRKAAQVIAMTRRFIDAPCVLTVHNLSKDTRLYSKFDSVIAVSGLVAAGLEHPRQYTVQNGC